MISMSRYISIISGVGGGAAVAQRQLIMRIVTQNSVLPPGLVAQFANPASVGAYFGTNSEEYNRATAYFSFVSKNINSPALISFARWVSTAIAPMIVGDTLTKSLAVLAAYTSGTLTLNVGATAIQLAGINLSSATTLTQVASLMQTAIQAAGVVIAAPAAPTTSSSAGGTLAGATYYVKTTYVNAIGETVGSSESTQVVAANYLLDVTSPAAETGATGWNVYVATATGAEEKQNATPIAIGTNWTLPTTGLVTGATVPTSNTTGNSQLTSATVSFNTNTNQYVLTGSNPGSGTLSATPTGLTTDVSAALGWTTGGTILVAGQSSQTAAAAIAASSAISNNFGSFVYATPSTPLQNTDIEAIAEWTDAQNNLYLYSLATPLANLQTLFALISGYSGVAINILSTTQTNDFVEQSPCEILAATNYNKAGASQNYMYYQFPNRNITVSDDNTANLADASRGNYIGVTQNAGQQLAFYQRGVLCGGSQAATDQNTFANEMWLKSSFSAQFMSLFLNVPEVPADDSGAAMLLGVMTPTIALAKTNGVISVGKTLNAVQQQYITSITGDSTAWRQVQTIGYWLSITFTSQTNPNSELTEWVANYQFVYSKSDAIRSVTGSDVMI
jgi:hypothetical protein